MGSLCPEYIEITPWPKLKELRLILHQLKASLSFGLWVVLARARELSVTESARNMDTLTCPREICCETKYCPELHVVGNFTHWWLTVNLSPTSMSMTCWLKPWSRKPHQK